MRKLLAATIAAAWGMACVNSTAALTQLQEARRLASELHLEFTKAAEASNRAVMAETDDVSSAAAAEARRAREVVERDVVALQQILQALSYPEDRRHLDAFKARWDENRRIYDEILPLAEENTNVKAQRLSFGAAREAADAFRVALDAAARSSAANRACCAQALAAKAAMAVLEIQVMQAPHIAESEDAAMTQMEKRMAVSVEAARSALDGLTAAATPATAHQLATARTALDRFMAVNAEIITLSRRNSDVRSLALSLGRKRTVVSECEDQLQALDQALATHQFSATR